MHGHMNFKGSKRILDEKQLLLLDRYVNICLALEFQSRRPLVARLPYRCCKIYEAVCVGFLSRQTLGA
jgi:hypothetical protein